MNASEKIDEQFAGYSDWRGAKLVQLRKLISDTDAAREHLLRHQPRVMFIGFLETDAWGHAGRYDNLLTSAHAVDQYIQRLWETMQSMDQYRDKTTFIISTDHGRGSGLTDWKNHGKTVEGVIRSTFVVDAEGKVELAQYNVKATGHVAKLRRDLGLDA